MPSTILPVVVTTIGGKSARMSGGRFRSNDRKNEQERCEQHDRADHTEFQPDLPIGLVVGSGPVLHKHSCSFQ